MVIAVIVTVSVVGSFLMWTLVKAAGDADKRLDEIYQAFLLGEEFDDGNRSKEVQQTA